MAQPDVLHLLYVCTGNAARSVMAEAMTRHRAPQFAARSAGTLSIPGLPMSQRTRTALRSLGIDKPGHTSRQLEAEDVAWADLIVVFEQSHIRHIREHHPEVAARASSMARLTRFLPMSKDEVLLDRVLRLDLAATPFESWEEVVDPAGGDQAAFDSCAAELSGAVDAFIAVLDQ